MTDTDNYYFAPIELTDADKEFIEARKAIDEELKKIILSLGIPSHLFQDAKPEFKKGIES